MLPIATMFRSLKLWLLSMTLALAPPAWAQQGALTVSRNLDELTDRAAVIVRGHVLSAEIERHEELNALDVLVVTLRVTESLKGDAAATFTFRQYLWDIRDRQTFAGYRKGQELLLMMIAPSRYGLSSPAGVEQGRFRIRRDESGREVAVNGHANYRLLDGVGAQLAKEGRAPSPAASRLIESHRQGPIPLATLTGLIRDLVGEQD